MQITVASYYWVVRIIYSLMALFLALDCLADPVDDLVVKLMAQHRIPGVALQVIQSGQPTKTATYGFANLEWQIPVTPATVFEIGSVTKQFTGACIMLLVEEGKLSLDDKISQHLTNTPASWKDITVRQLLTHTSGLKNYTGVTGFELARHLTQAQFIAKAAELPIQFAPGEKFSYCNTGYNLLGFIIENVSGKSYWEFLTEKILRPLGMNATTKREPSRVLPLRAAGYEKGKTNEFVNRDVDYTDLFSAGEIVSTLGDLAKWNAALDSERLLKNSSKAQLWTSGKLNDGREISYGFGWFLQPLAGHQNIGHSGSTSGFSASNQRFPDDDLQIILLCNSGEDGVGTLVAKAVAELYFKKQIK